MKNKIISLLNDFCIREYGEELSKDNLKDLTKVPIMYTDYEKGYDEEVIEDIKVQVFLDIENYKIMIEYNDIKVYEEDYDSIKEFIDVLEYLDFDSYTNLDELDKYFELKEMNLKNENNK